MVNDSITVPTKTGYAFGGYFTQTNGGGTQYVAADGATINSLYRAVAGNTTLYALWTGNRYSVFFDVNHDSVNPNLFVASKESVTRNGISYRYSASDDTVILNGTMTASGSDLSVMPFKAEAGTYKVTIEQTSGSVDTSAYGACFVLELKGTETLETRANLDFTGSGTTTWTISEADAAKINCVKLWQWKEKSGYLTATNATYQIKIEKASDSTVFSHTARTVIYASTYGTLPTPTRAGYTFNGWYTASSGGTKITSSSKVSITANQTLFAQWTAIPVTLSSISVKILPTKTTYTVGESFNQNGLTLTAKYSDNSTQTITSGFTCSGFSSATTGTKTITVTYEGKTTTFTVTVNPALVTLTSISVKTMPTNTTYTVGESFNQSGLTLTAKYSDNSTQTVTSGFTCSGFSNTTAGTKTITVTYEGKTTTFNVTVINKDELQTKITIHNYTADKTVDYKTTITFSADVENAISGAAVHWFIDGQDKGMGDKYTVTKATKSFTVQVKYMKDGKVLAESGVEKVSVKTGFFAKLAAFFRSIFGKLPKVVQGYLGAEIIEKFI